MEPSLRMFDAVLNPTAAFTPLLDWDEDALLPLLSWESSNLNPKNRIDSLDAWKDPSWRFDGIDVDGTRLFVVPTFVLQKPPLRIDVYIPGQDEYPVQLRKILRSGSSMILRGMELEGLEICRHVLRALEFWSRNIPNFETTYNELPFGSRIVVDRICSNVREMDIHMIPIYDVEQGWYSLQDLNDMWKLSPDNWPDSIDLADLRIHYQPHEAISLVLLPSHLDSKLVVFKSLVRDPKYLYHELKMLLTTSPHLNIVSRPLYIVTKKCRFGGKVGVCGFILEYYHLGALRDILWQSSSSLTPTFTLRDQFRWAREITEAIIHINNSAPGFYPDLKPDNVVITLRDGIRHAILIDLEQRGGWYSWSPPEVAYIEYLEYIASKTEDSAIRTKYTTILRSHIPIWKPLTQRDRYHDCERGFSSAWLSLTSKEREAAQVFMLGKLFWCIFESAGSINCGIGVDVFRERDCRHHFPEFQDTPDGLRSLIRCCTAGAPEWGDRYRNLYMSGAKLFSLERLSVDGRAVQEGSAAETQMAAKRWWAAEVQRATTFLERSIERKIGDDQDYMARDGVLDDARQRPSLLKVLSSIIESERTVLPYCGV